MRYNLGYKNSGVDWITYIPEHWEAVRLKELFHMRSGITFTKSELVEDGYATISYGQVHSKTNVGTRITHDMIRFIPPELVNEGALAKQGDFIFADTSEDLEGCGNCIWVNSSNHIYAGSHTILLKQKTPVKNAYLAYLFQTNAWRRQIRERVSGIKVYSITQSLLSFVSVIFPPLEEQNVIAEYLDRETARIDGIVERLRAQSERYEQLKRSLITETITQGLPHHDPSTFRSLRLKDIVDIEKGKDGAGENEQSDGYLPVLALAYLRGRTETPTYAPISPNSIICEGGELIIIWDGAGFGEILRAKKGLLSSTTAVIRERKELVLREYLYALRYYIEGAMKANPTGMGIPHINPLTLSTLPIVLPTIEEQSEIVEYLEKRCSRTERTLVLISRKIELLEQLKKSLIEEVVTGQRPVKN